MVMYHARKANMYYVGCMLIIVLQLLGVSSAAATKKTMTGVVITRHDSLNIRSGPGTSYSIIGKAEKNSTLTIREATGEWYHVQLSDGTVGYAFSQYLKIISRENLLNTAEAFIDAIGSEREIYLEPGDYILEDSIAIMGVKQLRIIGIQGDRPVRILVRSRTANVLEIVDSEDLLFENVVIGHAEGTDQHENGVLKISNASNITITNSTLYAGSYGVSLTEVKGFKFSHSTIKECTKLIMQLYLSKNITFENSGFSDNHNSRGKSLILIHECSNIQYTSCKIENNSTFLEEYDAHALFVVSLDSGVTIRDSHIRNNSSDYFVLTQGGGYLAEQGCEFNGNVFRQGKNRFEKKMIVQQFTVSTAEEFIDAVGSYREIYLRPGDYILDELVEKEHGHVKWGWGITLHNVEHLKIIGGQGDRPVRLLVRDRLQDVLKIEDSKSLLIENIVMGHAEALDAQDECGGGVLDIQRTLDVIISNTVLYGTGFSGLRLDQVNGLMFLNSTVKECIGGPVELYNSKNIFFENSRFLNNHGVSLHFLIQIQDSLNIQFTNCLIENNSMAQDWANALMLIESGSDIVIQDSRIKKNTAHQFIIPETEAEPLVQNCEFDGNIFYQGKYETKQK